MEFNLASNLENLKTLKCFGDYKSAVRNMRHLKYLREEFEVAEMAIEFYSKECEINNAPYNCGILLEYKLISTNVKIELDMYERYCQNLFRRRSY